MINIDNDSYSCNSSGFYVHDNHDTNHERKGDTRK